MNKSPVYIIHRTILERTDLEDDLLEFGVFGQYFSALEQIRSIAEIEKDDLEHRTGFPHIVEEEFQSGEDGYEYDLVTVHPDYDNCDCDDFEYCTVIEYFARPLSFTE